MRIANYNCTKCGKAYGATRRESGLCDRCREAARRKAARQVRQCACGAPIPRNTKTCKTCRDKARSVIRVKAQKTKTNLCQCGNRKSSRARLCNTCYAELRREAIRVSRAPIVYWDCPGTEDGKPCRWQSSARKGHQCTSCYSHDLLVPVPAPLVFVDPNGVPYK